MAKKKAPYKSMLTLPLLLSLAFISMVVAISSSNFTRTDARGMGMFCTNQYAPVCSTSGRTYPNSCYARRSGAVVACAGFCPCTSPSRQLPVRYR